MTFRYARHTSDIKRLERFYTKIVGLERLGSFENHNSYNGIFLGKTGSEWHLEFTESNEIPNNRFDEDDILVFYVYSELEMSSIKERLLKENIPFQIPKNPFWKENGIMISDPDGYKIVFSLRN